MIKRKKYQEFELDFYQGKNTSLTEGEKIIAAFLDKNSIEYRTQVYIYKLKSDNAPYRIPDFYLPRYKVFLEFKGKYRSPDENAEYHRKESIYEKNKIPYLLLYPDNLGTLDYIFHYRMLNTLKGLDLYGNKIGATKKWVLWKYKTDRYLDHLEWIVVNYILIPFGFLMIFSSLPHETSNGQTTIGEMIIWFIWSIILIGIFRVFSGIRKYFIKEQ